MHAGNHALVGSPFAPLRGWYPIEVLHFPLRSLAQCEHKAELQGAAFAKHIDRPPTAYHAQMFDALKQARSPSTTAPSSSTTRRSRRVSRGRSLSTPGSRRAARRGAGGEARVLDSDARRRGDLRRRGRHARGGRRRAAPAAARRARGAARRVELRLPNRVYRKLTGPVAGARQPVVLGLKLGAVPGAARRGMRGAWIRSRLSRRRHCGRSSGRGSSSRTLARGSRHAPLARGCAGACSVVVLAAAGYGAAAQLVAMPL